jgi:hypothetical protein
MRGSSKAFSFFHGLLVYFCVSSKQFLFKTYFDAKLVMGFLQDLCKISGVSSPNINSVVAYVVAELAVELSQVTISSFNSGHFFCAV